MPLDNYTAGSVNWRATLQKNNFRTYLVIGLFFFIYLGIGLLVDAFMVAGAYPRLQLNDIVYSLLTLQIFPIATLAMLIIAAGSLWVTYTFSDQLMLLGTEYHQITPETARTLQEKQLYNIIEELKIAAGMTYMPKVYIIDADYMNAFASGYSEKSAMVAITRGLITKLDRDEIAAVMAHELSHIRHLDIKLTLTASLLSNLSLMVLDIFFYSSYRGKESNSDSKSRNNLAAIIFLLRFLLPIINVILILYLSRTRELMADAGCVELTRTNEPLARALIKISGDHAEHKAEYSAAYKKTPHENVRREAYIYDPAESGMASFTSINDFFSTHPSLETRLQALGYTKRNKQ